MSELMIGMLVMAIIKTVVPIHKWHFDTWSDEWEFRKQFALGLLMTIAAMLVALCIWAYYQVLPAME